jgi:hypothetical protein
MKRRYSSPIAEQIFFHVVNKKHRWESLTAESRHFLDKHLKTDAPLQTTTVSVPANDKTAPWMPAGCATTVTFGTATSRGPGAHDDDVFYLFLLKQKI